MEDHTLDYCEPWSWMHPVRHVLGALALEQGEVNLAREMYEQDLQMRSVEENAHCPTPNNVWSLRGLVECLGDGASDDLKMKLKTVEQFTSRKIVASCACAKRDQW